MEETLRIVDAQTQEAAAKKQVVEGEEAIASEKAAAAKAIKVGAPFTWVCAAAWSCLDAAACCRSLLAADTHCSATSQLW